MVELDVSGMTCGGCAKSVEKAVLKADPGASVTVDLPTGVVRVDSARAAGDLAAAVRAAGWDVTATRG